MSDKNEMLTIYKFFLKLKNRKANSSIKKGGRGGLSIFFLRYNKYPIRTQKDI